MTFKINWSFMLCSFFKYSIISIFFHEASFFHGSILIIFSQRNLNQLPLSFFSPQWEFFCQGTQKNLCLIDNNRALQCLSSNLHTLFSRFFLSCTISAISPHLPLILLSVNLFISDQRRMHDPNLPPILSSTHRSHRMRQYAATSTNEPCPNPFFFFFFNLFKDPQ